MKILISYFYQIRNFTSNMLPLSTAIYPPKWYRQMGENNWFVDKNNVINGLDIPELAFPKHLFEEDIADEEKCCYDCPFYNVIQQNPQDISHWCTFMKIYYRYLDSLDFNDIINKYESNVIRLFNKKFGKNIDTLVLIVHEPPHRRCAERIVLQRYFRDHGIELEEWANG